MKSTRALLALVVFSGLLAGCAGLQRQGAAGDVARLAGRLSVTVAGTGGRATGGSAGFELIGDPGSGQLELTSPLGALVARARWQPGVVSLQTPESERRFDSLDDLTREMLGEPVPVAALFDWLRGRPWSGAHHHERPQGFEQLGWRVDLSRQPEGLVLATRLADPVVTLRARLEGGDEGAP